MKCKFVIDAEVDVTTLDDEQKWKLHWRTVTDAVTGQPKQEPYFPAGTEYEHPNAAFFCNVGMAIPADDECEAKATPMTPEQRSRTEKAYRADSLGIVDPVDRQLFFGGVIEGYERVNGQLAYLPGPNYEKWKAAQEANKPPDEGI